MNVGMPPGNVEALRPLLLVGHGVALALLVPLLLAWARHPGRRLLTASTCSIIVALVIVYWASVRPSDIPIDWVTVLHEGLGRQTIMHLYARGVHAGANFAFVLSAIAAGPAPTLHDVVWLNLLLALVNAVIFFHVALHVVAPLWAVIWTLVFALNPATFLASFSELPTNLLGLYFLAGVLAWEVLTDSLPQPSLVRGAAGLFVAAVTILVALTRIEVALIGVVGLGLQAGYVLLGAEGWSLLGQRLRTAGEAVLVFLSDHPVALVGLCVLGMRFSISGLKLLPAGLSGREPLSAVYPFNSYAFSFFVFLPMLALPVGVSVAILFGLVHSVRNFLSFGGLALSLFILVRAFFAAENQYFEMGRYLGYVFPALCLVGLFGKGALEDLARRWRPNWYRAVRVGYLMAWFTLPLPGLFEFYGRPDFHLDGGLSQFLLDRNTQQEVRYLMSLTENNPRCVFVGRVVQDDRGDPKVATTYSYAIFGTPVRQPIVVPEQEAPLAQVIAHYAPGASCIRLYYGGDCNLTFSDRCTDFVAGRRRLDEYRFWSRPYNNPVQAGYGAPEIVLATYAWS